MIKARKGAEERRVQYDIYATFFSCLLRSHGKAPFLLPLALHVAKAGEALQEVRKDRRSRRRLRLSVALRPSLANSTKKKSAHVQACDHARRTRCSRSRRCRPRKSCRRAFIIPPCQQLTRDASTSSLFFSSLLSTALVCCVISATLALLVTLKISFSLRKRGECTKRKFFFFLLSFGFTGIDNGVENTDAAPHRCDVANFGGHREETKIGAPQYTQTPSQAREGTRFAKFCFSFSLFFFSFSSISRFSTDFSGRRQHH